MDEFVEASIQDRLCVSLLYPGPMILDHLVRVEDVRADLAAETRVGDLAPFLGELRLALLELVLGQTALQDPHRRLPVRELRALVLALDDDPGRDVRDPDGRVGL